jgi:glycosyltransferase involved in cell wall biosynthesis
MKKLPLSVFIITRNEADRVAATIRSVRDIADEIIVIDSESTDDTVAVATAEGARVVVQPWLGYGLQKRFGEDQCKNTWLLNLDADEELTPKLAKEIEGMFAMSKPLAPAYTIQIRDMLPGEKMLVPSAHTNFCIRLYDRTKARFSDSPVHDSVIVAEGKPAMLKAPALHRSFRDIGHAVEKLNSYSRVQAEQLALKKSLPYPGLRLAIEFPMAFLKVYFARGYVTRGRRGFTYAIVYAFGRFVRIAKYLEKLESK